jgi:hypothetical protein
MKQSNTEPNHLGRGLIPAVAALALIAPAAGNAALMSAVPAGTLSWEVSFEIVESATEIEEVKLSFQTGNQLVTQGAFQGYLIDFNTLLGTQDGVPVVGVDMDVVDFNGTLNDNLFINVEPFFSLGGLAYETEGANPVAYQLFWDSELLGCEEPCGGTTGVDPFRIRGFESQRVPEPGPFALIIFGTTLLGWRRLIRSR